MNDIARHKNAYPISLAKRDAAVILETTLHRRNYSGATLEGVAEKLQELVVRELSGDISRRPPIHYNMRSRKTEAT